MKITNVQIKNIKSLVCEFDIAFGSGMKITCCMFNGERGYYIVMPSSEYQGKDGKTKRKPLVTWADSDQTKRFNEWALAELRKASPAAFGEISHRNDPSDDYNEDNLPF
jgi:DNA-binding cell septation regulator SpoVG